MTQDLVNNPPHYTMHPSGVECIEIVKHMNFCCGNVIKYLWRSGLKELPKSSDPLQDLKKARFYLNTEIERLENVSR